MYILGGQVTNVVKIRPKSSEIITVAGGREGRLGKNKRVKSSFIMVGHQGTVFNTDNPKNHD